MYSTYKTMMSILFSCVFVFFSYFRLQFPYVFCIYVFFFTSLHLNTLVSLTFIFRARKFNSLVLRRGLLLAPYERTLLGCKYFCL